MSEFTYNASALGLGGVLNINGQRTVIPSVAQVALAPTGGEAHASESNFFNNGIGFDHAESHIYGFDDGDDRYTTYSDVTVSGLNVLNRLRIGLMKAKLESRHDLNADGDSRFSLTVEYRDVQVDGCDVIPDVDFNFTQNWDTYQKIDYNLRQNPAHYEQRFGLEGGKLIAALDKNPTPPLAASVVKDLAVNHVRPSAFAVPVKAKAHGLVIPKLGKAHFAEYQVKRGRRRITLLRLDFNSMQELFEQLPQQSDPMAENQLLPLAMNQGGQQIGGSMSFTSLDGNGSPPWDK